MTAKAFGLCLCVVALLGGVVGCVGAGEAGDESPTAAGSEPTFEQWKDSVRIRGYTDRYAVGDRIVPLVLVGDEDARGYYDRQVRKASVGEVAQGLIIDNGQYQPGDPSPGEFYAFPPGAQLTYCIDRAGLRDVVTRWGLPAGTDLYDIVDQAMGDAASAWNVVSGLSITQATDRDESCSFRPGDNITWYVKPYAFDPDHPDVDYLAYVLGPKYNQKKNQAAPNDYHDFLILDYLIQRQAPKPYIAANDPPWDKLFTFRGLLSHTLANALGFIDEKNRGDGACRDPSVGGIFLTDVDSYSVTMHPKSMVPILDPASKPCTGDRPFDYVISYADAMGAACQYNPSAWTAMYYCQADVQAAIRSQQGPECSPVPLGPGAAGDCSGPNGNGATGAAWGLVQNDADQYAAAMYYTLFPPK